MSLSPDQHQAIERFVSLSDLRKGAWFVDLDGVIFIQEGRGKFNISEEAEHGILNTWNIGCSVIINSLRFPLSIIENLVPDWLLMYEKDIPAVLLNGGLIGYFRKKDGGIVFEELEAHPLSEKELDSLVDGLTAVIANSIPNARPDMALFFYPRDWRKGEIVWVPEGVDVDAVRDGYVNASEVMSCGLEELRQKLKKARPCLAATLVDKHKISEDASPWDYYTWKGIDKATGAREIASMLGISLADSAGAGDSQMDKFLSEVGLAVRVRAGKENLAFKGKKETLDVGSSPELGEVMSTLARLTAIKSS